MPKIDLNETPTVLGKPMYYKLDKDKNVVPATRGEMIELFDKPDSRRRVAVTEVGESSVSTVFLVLDHNYGDSGDPIVFETMIFGGPYSEYQRRYTTWSQALAGHRKIVRQLKMGVNPYENS